MLHFLFPLRIMAPYLLISLQVEQHFQLRSLWQDVGFFNFNFAHVTQNPTLSKLVLIIFI